MVFYPIIVTKGKETEYAPLINVFCALSVDNQLALSVNANHTVPPPCNTTLAREYNEVAKRLFHALHTNNSVAQQTIIAIKLNKLTTAHNVRFEAY